MTGKKGRGICPRITVGQQPGVPCRGDSCGHWYGEKYGCAEIWKATALIDIANALTEIVECLKTAEEDDPDAD
jgi:hypothetical protein